MMLHPEIQKKAQSLIDKVTGGERLPTFSDRNALPYIEAILSEVLRSVVNLSSKNKADVIT